MREKLPADERDGDDSADDPLVVFAREGVGRRGYVVSPAPFDALGVGRRYRVRSGTGYGSRQRIEGIVRPESPPAFGSAN